MKLVDNTEKGIEALRNSMPQNMETVGLKFLSTMQDNTPVDSGTLKRAESYTISESENNCTLEVGVSGGQFVNSKNGAKVEDYAAKVEFEDKSYIRYTGESLADEVQTDIAKAVKEILEGI